MWAERQTREVEFPDDSCKVKCFSIYQGSLPAEMLIEIYLHSIIGGGLAAQRVKLPI